MGGIFGGGGAGASASLFAPSDAGKVGDLVSGGRGSKTEVIVDLRNLPRGTRTETRADSGVDLEVYTGFAMQGAH